MKLPTPTLGRMWRGDNNGLDEIDFWGVSGQKLGTYQISTGTSVTFTLKTTNVYFGGKLVSKGTNQSGTYDHVQLSAVTSDRLGSLGKFYPYGQEKPSATTNDTEKFTGYFRDAATGLDYADQRYHQPGMGRFMTPDSAPSAKAIDPGSWNKYAYAGGDPVNHTDPTGQYWILVGNIWVGDYPGAPSVGTWECDYYCSFGAAIGSYYQNLTNQYLTESGALSDAQATGLISGYSVDYFTGSTSLTLSGDYSQFFQYLQDCGCRPIDWGGAWDDIIGAVRNGSLVVKNLPLFVLVGLEAIFKKDNPVGRPKAGVPTGTKPIDQMGWDKDRIHDIKEGIGAGNEDWVGVDPDGNVWTGSPDGTAVDHGPWGPYTNH